MINNYNNQDLDHYVGHRAKMRRLALGLSLKEVAEMIGVDIAELKKYEKGLHKIYGNLYNLARCFKVSIYYFFEEAEDGLDKKYVNYLKQYSTKHKSKEKVELPK